MEIKFYERTERLWSAETENGCLELRQYPKGFSIVKTSGNPTRVSTLPLKNKDELLTVGELIERALIDTSLGPSAPADNAERTPD